MVSSLHRFAKNLPFFSAGILTLCFSVSPALGQANNAQPLIAEKPEAIRVSEATGIKTRGIGPNRELLISGSVYDSLGQPAEEFQLQVDIRKGVRRHALKPTIRENHYDVWVPIGGSDWFYLTLLAKTQEQTQAVSEKIERYELRRRAISGFDLMLKKTDRLVTVKVTHNGEPVSGAHVSSQLAGGMIRLSTTDSNGVASLRVGNYDTFQALTAWTDDFQLGGYMLRDHQARDPKGDEFEVAIHDCRDLKIQLINAEDNSPVSDVQFSLSVATAPDFHFLGTSDTIPQASLTTDRNGEAVYRWLPDWEQHGAIANLEDPNWILAKVNLQTLKPEETLVVKLKPRAARKTLRGQVVSRELDVGHLLVEAITFQNETRGTSDYNCVFTDHQGHFSVECLPGSTYCVFVNDPMCVSNIIDLIPYDSETGKTDFASLQLSEGVPVEVRATVGTDHQLMRKALINYQVPHELSWMDNGKTISGDALKEWSLRTNYSGVARTSVLPGSELNIMLYDHDWIARRKVVVRNGPPNRIEIHRAIAGNREVKGRLILADGLDADLAGAVLEVGSVDGETKDRQTVRADDQGRFSFQSHAIDIGFFAYTTDGKAAVIAHRKRVNEPLILQLLPTVNLTGQLLGKENQPVSDHPVFTTFHVEGEVDPGIYQYDTRFTVKTPEVRTDTDGNYILSGLPRNVELGVWTDAINDPSRTIGIGELTVDLGETPKPRLSHLARPERQ